MKLKFVLFYSLLIIGSCKKSSESNSNESSIEKIIINLDQLKPAYSIDSPDYQFVELESNDSSIIGSIDKMSIYNDKIFILDTHLTKSIFCFSTSGKFLFKINTIGDGIGEFNKPFDMSLFNNELYVLDLFHKKTIVFDLDGNFKHESRIPFEGQVVSFLPINNYLTAYHIDLRSYGSDEHELINVFENKTGSMVAKGAIDIGNTDTYKSAIEFSKYGNNIRFLHAWTDTIFNISENSIIPELILDFGKDRLTKNTKKMLLNEMRNFFMENPYVFNAGNLIENDNYLSFHWVKSKSGFNNSEDQEFVSYYHKQSKKLCHFPLENNWLKGTSLRGPVYGSEAFFFGYLTYDDWLKLPNVSQTDSTPHDSRNPVIVKYTLNP
ncbi:6-bladed beta-propeller [Lunatimonas salinarum]|uniref:6-bladed beta-propeller n=1 Tax=Lunatimonas salinarum TaxID=1774590 RepID=UPI001AE0BFE2|nr:6-bladed beta-propeller [Lunatimonas salinarum]